jgi:hypothetical protein
MSIGHGWTTAEANDPTADVSTDNLNNHVITPEYLGHDAIGANEESVTFLRWYCKRITTTAAVLLQGIEVYIKEASPSVQEMYVALFADNAGAIGDAIASGGSIPLAIANSPTFASNYRWHGAAIPRALAASTSYWIGWMFWKPFGGGPDARHKYDTGGSDRRFDAADHYITDGGYATETDTTFEYSARALVL